MTSEPKPYTVADLRRWANQHREFACSGYQEIDPAHAADARAQAAAFDALADGIEACEKPVENVGDDYTSKMVRHAMIGTLEIVGRILRGEAVKDRKRCARAIRPQFARLTRGRAMPRGPASYGTRRGFPASRAVAGVGRNSGGGVEARTADNRSARGRRLPL